jgi:hypothetical protein
MGSFSKPDKCSCGAGVSFYSKSTRGWECGRRDRWDILRESWVNQEVCPIPDLVKDTKAENLRLRNTISQLTERIAELEADKSGLEALSRLRKESATSA